VTQRRWTARLVVAGAALTLLASACAKDDAPSAGGGGLYGGSGSGSSASAGAGASTAGGSGSGTSGNYGGGNYGGGYGQGGGSGSSGGASVQTISQENFSFSPSTFTVKGGDTITVKNTTTTTEHTFTIDGENVDVAVDPATSAKVKLDLPPGDYPFFCRFHESEGMTGTLTVK
jgi:plastocyanin